MTRRQTYPFIYMVLLVVAIAVYSCSTPTAKIADDTTLPNVPPVEQPVSATTPGSAPGVVTSSTTTTTLPPLVVPADAKCPQWWDEAVSVGWPAELLPQLDLVMFREARCLPAADSGADVGLVQINNVHLSWLAERGITRDQLADPLINLTVGWWLYLEAADNGGCGWQPWFMSSSEMC